MQRVLCHEMPACNETPLLSAVMWLPATLPCVAVHRMHRPEVSNAPDHSRATCAWQRRVLAQLRLAASQVSVS